MPAQKTVLDGTFTISSIVVLVSLVAGFLAIIAFFRKVSRENADDANRRTTEILEEVRANRETADSRLVKVETRIADFMPRAEIEQRIEHLKINRQTVESALSNQLEKLSTEQVRQGIQIGKLEERHEGMAATMSEVKILIKDLATDMKAGFKDIAERKAA